LLQHEVCMLELKRATLTSDGQSISATGTSFNSFINSYNITASRRWHNY